jgi:hypothetical protein
VEVEVEVEVEVLAALADRVPTRMPLYSASSPPLLAHAHCASWS